MSAAGRRGGAMTGPDGVELWTVSETAARCGVCRRTVFNWIEAGAVEVRRRARQATMIVAASIAPADGGAEVDSVLADMADAIELHGPMSSIGSQIRRWDRVLRRVTGR